MDGTAASDWVSANDDRQVVLVKGNILDVSGDPCVPATGHRGVSNNRYPPRRKQKSIRAVRNVAATGRQNPGLRLSVRL